MFIFGFGFLLVSPKLFNALQLMINVFHINHVKCLFCFLEFSNFLYFDEDLEFCVAIEVWSTITFIFDWFLWHKSNYFWKPWAYVIRLLLAISVSSLSLSFAEFYWFLYLRNDLIKTLQRRNFFYVKFNVYVTKKL